MIGKILLLTYGIFCMVTPSFMTVVAVLQDRPRTFGFYLGMLVISGLGIVAGMLYIRIIKR
jgi:hypothetical protein